MTDSLETFRDVLLVFTVIVLVYVLYKRLLRVLGKEDQKKKYPNIGEQIVWKNERLAEIEITLLEDTHLHLEIFDDAGSKMLDVLNSAFKVGVHHISLDFSTLTAGRYYFKITSPFQESSQYVMLR